MILALGKESASGLFLEPLIVGGGGESAVRSTVLDMLVMFSQWYRSSENRLSRKQSRKQLSFVPTPRNPQALIWRMNTGIA